MDAVCFGLFYIRKDDVFENSPPLTMPLPPSGSIASTNKSSSSSSVELVENGHTDGYNNGNDSVDDTDDNDNNNNDNDKLEFSGSSISSDILDCGYIERKECDNDLHAYHHSTTTLTTTAAACQSPFSLSPLHTAASSSSSSSSTSTPPPSLLGRLIRVRTNSGDDNHDFAHTHAPRCSGRLKLVVVAVLDGRQVQRAACRVHGSRYHDISQQPHVPQPLMDGTVDR